MNTEIEQHIAASLGESQRSVGRMLDAFVSVVRGAAVAGGTVAVPSFGTFSSRKVDEEVVTDRVTGRRMLLPPQIVFEFQPAAMLRKKLVDSHE